MTFFQILNAMKEGISYSLQIFFLTLIFSLPLGLLICLGRMSKFKPVSWLFKLYISIMRGTPLMLQLFVVYFVPWYLFKIKLSFMGENWLFISVIIGFSLNYAAYFAEIFRGGIESVAKGQYEAGYVLGMSKTQTFFIIVFPQVIRYVLPSITNEVITLVKDTSLAFAISQVEMFTIAKRLASSQTSMVPYAVAALLYYIFNLAVAYSLSLLEKRLNRYSIR